MEYLKMKYLSLILFNFFLVAPSWGATYYVDNASLGGACSDSLTGTSLATPWCTLTKANSTVKAGDTVILRQGTYNQQIAPAQNGTASQPITYKQYNTEQILLTAKPSISLVNRSYIVIDGVTIRVSGCSGVCYALLDGSSHNTIQNSIMDQSTNQSSWPMGVRIKNNSQYNQLLNNTIGNVGYSVLSPGDDIGGVVDIGNIDNTAFDGSNYNLVKGNTLFHGGHHVLSIGSSNNVIKGNYIHNEEWNTCARTVTGGKCGDRLIAIDEEATLVRQNVIEDNILGYSGLPADQDGADGVSLRTPYNILRRNIFIDNDEAGINVSTQSYYPHDVRFNHIYNNTFFHNGYSVYDNYKPFEAGISLTKFGTTDITDVTIKNNIFWKDNGQQAIGYYTAATVDPAKQIISNNSSETQDPLFVNSAAVLDPLHPEYLDFHLKPGSPAIDTGGFLTTTTVGGSGTVIQVADAAYFTNGFGLIPGDLIQLNGQTQKARITAIDYVQNTLTVDASLTWQQGQGISLAYEGSAPDQGAYEFIQNSGGNLSPPLNLRVVL
ncbi:MAG: hypothetical protein ACXVJM_21850 [Mucilaginibacter sp.]